MRAVGARHASPLLLAVLLLAQPDELALKSRRAKELMAAGRYAEAIPVYSELVRAVPNNPGLILNLGLAQQLAGQPRNAIRQFEAAAKLQPDLYPAWFSLGTIYLELGDPVRAVGPLEKAAALQPTDPRAQFALGRSYEALSRRAFERLDKLAQGSAWWLALAAETRMSQGQYSSAFGLYREALAKMPALPGAHAALAEIYRKTGHPDWAAVEERKEQARPQPDWKTARGVQPATPESYYRQARAYNALAAETFSRLAQLPPSVELHQWNAQVASAHGRYLDAAAELRAALKLAPSDPQFRTQLAAALHQAQDHRGAQAVLEELLTADPEAPQLNFMYGDTLLLQGQPEKAIPYLEKAAQQVAARASLGLAYMRTGQPQRAIPHLKAALETDTDGSLHYQLARALQMAGQAEAAAPLLKQYQELQRRAQPEEARITPP